jgi:hypothetical protein
MGLARYAGTDGCLTSKAKCTNRASYGGGVPPHRYCVRRVLRWGDDQCHAPPGDDWHGWFPASDSRFTFCMATFVCGTRLPRQQCTPLSLPPLELAAWLAANLHEWTTATSYQASIALSLLAWPLLTIIPPFVAALVAAALLNRWWPHCETDKEHV